ncbi:septal ring lytic transglycosylase RlpA family protein [Chelativorans sp. ZYF759]|uniref:septal ring lytic transglycosylase RlpA family protein n=1 Tax=Chelativorans sp. ZYF759 TaxID=2692213 RepID=UPI00145E9700|nr:septal ring lytic transglycosylase RlpA family protein [Chelativorans sp. ZYF759]NMG38498.1 septal ring lytic transglycosylase RlpA family protein [Chelativorans sp. ZYF759]
MPFSGQRLFSRAPAAVIISCCAALLAACGAKPTQQTAKQTRTGEYFAESIWGVAASPRVSNLERGLPRGGGRDHVGRPYQIRGQWFHPKEEPDYRKVGQASWYGSAFHGRLTANGEVYDMHHLTAAHPTMPLPSYARVTNLENGTSLVVRVNDRGPFVSGRIIDLSRRSAEVLGTKGNGVARVQVEYLGRAPLHGQDEQFLMASYRPGGRGPDPSDGLPSGVMMAMNGATPSAAAASAPAFDGRRPGAAIGATGAPASTPGSAGDFPTMPQHGPILPQRPQLLAQAQAAGLALSYADHRIVAASAALEGLASGRVSDTAAVASWERRNAEQAAAANAVSGMHVAAGTFADEATARRLARPLAALGAVEILAASGGMSSLVVRPDGRASIDDILKAAWDAGATDALTVRD